MVVQYEPSIEASRKKLLFFTNKKKVHGFLVNSFKVSTVVSQQEGRRVDCVFHALRLTKQYLSCSMASIRKQAAVVLHTKATP